MIAGEDHGRGGFYRDGHRVGCCEASRGVAVGGGGGGGGVVHVGGGRVCKGNGDGDRRVRGGGGGGTISCGLHYVLSR